METLITTNFNGFSGDNHKVGLSAPLSELTADDIINFDKFVCGAVNNYANVEYIGKNPQISLPESADNKIIFSRGGWDNSFWCKKPTERNIYIRTILLATTHYKTNRDYNFTKNDTDVRIVTEITDYQDLFITTNIGKSHEDTFTQITGAGLVSTGRLTNIYKSDIVATGGYITPVWCITDGVHVWLRSGRIYDQYYCNFNNNFTSQGFSTGSVDFDNNTDFYLSWGFNPNTTNEPILCTDLIPNDTPVQIENNGKTFGFSINYHTLGSGTGISATQYFNNNIDSNSTPFLENNPFIDINTFFGLYMRSPVFYEGNYVWYKPIIKNGIVTGYTTDLQSESEIDEWETLENHNVPISPSTTVEDDIDDIGLNDFPFNYVGGLARYYAIDRFQLDELIADFKKSEAGIPLDAGQFVIGLYQLPLDIPTFCTTNQEKIVLGKLETNAVGKRLITVNRKIHLGDYFISANCGNNFLDYSPYTEIKLYIPYCGIIELPPNLFINSTVSVYMIIDIISGSCKGVVMCNNTFYTSLNGSLMCSLPLSLEQCATKSLNIINSANNIINGIIGSYPIYSGLNTVTTLGESFITNNNIAPSYKSGSMDSVVNYYVPQCCILFMSYPQVNMGDIGKTHGKVCNYQDTLNNCHGYTVVDNPHIEIKCTNTEKDEITKLLENGVILP